MRALREQKGASAVEFALILPLLVVFVFGIIEFGLLLYNQQVITNASREGARAGIVQPPGVSFATIQGVVQTYTSNHLVTFTSGVVTPTVTVLNTTTGGNVCVSFSDNLRVTVTYPYTFLAFNGALKTLEILGVVTSPVGTNNSLTLTAQTVMRCE
jgi:Flp pilus assembly protein TadG